MTTKQPSEILDLDAPTEEPEVEPFQFKFAGETFTCQPPEALDIREIGAITAAANEDPGVLLQVMLAADELARLDALEATFNLGMFKRVREAYEAHYGMDAPKASGSRKPSRNKKVR